nr:MAG TPA_asm: hypothetical protein [Caudoviricetes sp.]
MSYFINPRHSRAVESVCGEPGCYDLYGYYSRKPKYFKSQRRIKE